MLSLLQCTNISVKTMRLNLTNICHFSNLSVSVKTCEVSITKLRSLSGHAHSIILYNGVFFLSIILNNIKYALLTVREFKEAGGSLCCVHLLISIAGAPISYLNDTWYFPDNVNMNILQQDTTFSLFC